MGDNYTLSYSKECKTYVHLWKTARLAFEESREDIDGTYYRQITCLIFCAFTLEAYLNHIGKTRLGNWHIYERKLNPKEKLEIIHNELRIVSDWSREPLQTVSQILKFRSAIAHGKTEKKDGEKEIKRVDRYELRKFYDATPAADWKNDVNKEFLEQAMSQIEKIIAGIHSKSDLGSSLFHSFGPMSATVSKA